MSSGPGVVWRFGQQGAEDVKARIKELHDEFQRGDITIGQYARGEREMGRDVRAITGEFRLETNAMLAAHPALLQLTQATSIFASVAHTSLSILNAINLAMIASTGIESQISDLKIKRAEVENQLARMRAAGLQDSAAYQIMLGKEKDLDAEITAKEKELAQQQFQNSITFAVSIAVLASNIVSQIPRIVTAIGRIRSAMLDLEAVTALAGGTSIFSGLSAAAGKAGVAAGIALDAGIIVGVVTAGVLLSNYILQALSPDFKDLMTRLQDSIIRQWNVPPFIAGLVAPFVELYISVAQIGGLIFNTLATMANSIITSIINPLIDAINLVFHTHLGHVSTIPLMSMDKGDIAKKDLGIAGTTYETYSSLPSGPKPLIGPQGSSGTSINTTINIGGSVISEKQLGDIVTQRLKDDLKSAGFNR